MHGWCALRAADVFTSAANRLRINARYRCSGGVGHARIRCLRLFSIVAFSQVLICEILSGAADS